MLRHPHYAWVRFWPRADTPAPYVHLPPLTQSDVMALTIGRHHRTKTNPSRREATDATLNDLFAAVANRNAIREQPL